MSDVVDGLEKSRSRYRCGLVHNHYKLLELWFCYFCFILMLIKLLSLPDSNTLHSLAFLLDCYKVLEGQEEEKRNARIGIKALWLNLDLWWWRRRRKTELRYYLKTDFFSFSLFSILFPLKMVDCWRFSFVLISCDIQVDTRINWLNLEGIGTSVILEKELWLKLWHSHIHYYWICPIESCISHELGFPV